MKDRIPIAQWPELFDAVCRRNALLNRMFADMAYGNLRFAFALARAKTLGDVLQLQADYWQNFFNVLQGKEFRDAFFAFGAAGSRAASAESPRAESSRAESAKAESARAESPRAESAGAERPRAESSRAETSRAESSPAFAQPSIAASPVIPAATEAKIAASAVAPSPAKTPKQGSEGKRAAATRAAQSKTKSEKPQARPERHRAEPRGARKPVAAPRRPAPQEAVAPGGRSEIRFGRLDDNAVRFTGKEAWRLRNGTWRKIPLAKVAEDAVVLSKARFDQMFPKVPKLPAGAFKRERD